MSIWDTLFDWFGTAFDEISGWLGDTLIEPVMNVMLYTPMPLHNGGLALIRKPTNAPWREVYEIAHTQILPLVFTILFLMYAVSYFIQALGKYGFQMKEIQGNIVSALILTYLTWPLGVGILAFSNGVIHALAPDAGEVADVVTAMLGAATASSLAGFNAFAILIGGVDLTAFSAAAGLYLLRIIYLIGFMMVSFLSAAFYLAEIPVLKTLSSAAWVLFIVLSIVPLFVAAGMRAVVVFWQSNILLEGIGAGSIMAMVLSAVIPLGAIFGVIGSGVLSLIFPFVGRITSAVGGGSAGSGSGSGSATGLTERGEQYIEGKAERLDQGLDTTRQWSLDKGSTGVSMMDDHMGEDGYQPSEVLGSKAASAQQKATEIKGRAADSAAGTASDVPVVGGSISQPLEQIAEEAGVRDVVDEMDFEDGRPEPGNIDPGAVEPTPISDDALGELDEEDFERGVENMDDVNRARMSTVLSRMRDRHGQQAVDRFAYNIASSQAASDSGAQASQSTADRVQSQTGGPTTRTGANLIETTGEVSPTLGDDQIGQAADEFIQTFGEDIDPENPQDQGAMRAAAHEFTEEDIGDPLSEDAQADERAVFEEIADRTGASGSFREELDARPNVDGELSDASTDPITDDSGSPQTRSAREILEGEGSSKAGDSSGASTTDSTTGSTQSNNNTQTTDSGTDTDIDTVVDEADPASSDPTGGRDPVDSNIDPSEYLDMDVDTGDSG